MTREAVRTQLFKRLAEWLESQERTLDAVIFSGDAQSQGEPGGHELVFRLVTERLASVGVTPGRIVATPGNHDVPRDAPPSSAERYAAFNKVWRDVGCVVPWLDGIDTLPIAATATERHYLIAADASWAVFPVNSCNWSHVTVDAAATLTRSME